MKSTRGKGNHIDHYTPNHISSQGIKEIFERITRKN